jgi:hypothetical protein
MMIQGVAVGELGDLGLRMCALGLRMERGNNGKRRQAAGAGSPMREPRKSWVLGLLHSPRTRPSW